MTRGTASGRRPPREWFPALAVALTISVPVSADVLVKQETVSERMGGSGNSTVNRTLRVSADRSRSEERGTAAGVTGGGKPIHHVSISRLDKEVT